MEDGSNLHRELLFAATALKTLLVGQPDEVIHLATANAELVTVRPAHCRYFINANLLFAEVLNCRYECGWICHNSTLQSHLWFVKYISTFSEISVAKFFQIKDL